jgi:integrase
MSAATFKPELKKPPRQDGTCAVRIRITRFRQHSYWNVGRYVLPGEWNLKPKRHLKNWVLKNALAPQINNAINNTLSNLEAIADANPGFTAAQIKEAYEQQLSPEPAAVPVTFWAFAETFIERAKETSFNTGMNYHYLVAEFKAIAGEHTPYVDLFSGQVGLLFLKAIKAKGNGPVTVRNKINDLRKIYNAGAKAKVLTPLPEKPFNDLNITVSKKKKLRPTAAQVVQILNYEPKTELQKIGKTVATLQYLLQGARVAEALTLEWANVQKNYIEYLPQKKAGKPKFVPRSKMLNDLLNKLPKNGRYVLPYIGEDYYGLPTLKKHYRKKRIINQVNKGLQEIGAALGLEIELTSHMFRHAFADAVIAAGANTHTAAALLGHSNPSTTERYIKDLGLEEVSEMARSIFDKLEGENLGKQ